MNSINEIIDELTENDEEIIPYLRDLKNDIPSKFDFPKILTEIFEDAGVSYKPTEEFANHLYKYLGMNNWSDDVLGGWLFKDLYDEIYDYWADKDEYQIQMGYDFGVEYGDILYSGRLLGRMWPDKGLITFYPGQQPSREEMKMVITDISSRMGIEYEDLLKFYTIFEIGSKEVYTGTGYKGHDDATVQCCTIAEYIEGKYVLKNYCQDYIEENVLPLFKKNNLNNNQFEVLKSNIEKILECCELPKDFYKNEIYPQKIKKLKVDRQKSIEAMRKFRKEFGITEKEFSDEGIIKRLEENGLDINKTFQKIFG
jgi:hypothetical protein